MRRHGTHFRKNHPATGAFVALRGFEDCRSAGDLRKGLAEKRDLTDELEGKLKQAINDFKSKVWKK